ncbi:cytosolic 5'-nucleotidase 3-like [Diorhabda sublineata]|uniref:cytosolic 5'-nucleotidase 3-like n=1 Tax=Diorhabda sublineata TaxID=1163346 RepID=UPI0024E0DC3C|nr:cytosolic 5'-nucleotidase 3-like [Diorhabda sublineata]
MADYVKQLELVAKNEMIIRNRSAVNEKLEKLIKDGISKVQVISDFDGTITKQHVNNKTQSHGYLILYQLPFFPPELPRRAFEIKQEYTRYLSEPNLEYSERLTRMSELWSKSIEVFNGFVITKNQLDDHCLNLGLQLRDNTKEFFNLLEEEEIPILLVSAGIGDIIESTMRNEGVSNSKIEIAANYLNFDHEGRLNGLKTPPIHKLNKTDCIKDKQFYNTLKEKGNVIVIGDQLGDAVMVEKLDNVNTVLKIGFFYGEPDSALPKWQDTFDIILKDDQSMNIPNAVLNLLKNK